MPASRRKHSESEVADSLEHERRSVLGNYEATYASDFAALWNGTEAGCPRGDGRRAQHAGSPPGPSVNSSPGDASLIGDAHVASKKKKGKRKKGKSDLPWPRGGTGVYPIK